jgi:hypothetical protein
MATNRDGAINFKLMIAKDHDLKKKKQKMKSMRAESTIAFKIAYNESIAKQSKKESFSFGSSDDYEYSKEGMDSDSKFFSIPENRKNLIEEEKERSRLIGELNSLWKEIIPHDPNSVIEDVDVFEVFIF